MKKVADVEESSFAFKIDGYYPRKVTVPMELLELTHIHGAFNKFPDFFVLAFKIVVDS